ncbi:LOW QUALITY PROTEIN: (R)-mandelonitrile lyase-like [Prosopis cineraria]|uniref:LOW QUALITY PROTEIN: (R)-mandelonitrile lyase-like n=1 Tax=Prosopis cineraria TaxID=364024 RepID=UPI002410AC7A|nr:LOW QUALITY PROTEIN: (R)-mandelonitrile lyase-like [Prosopis cineraria]
MATRFTITLLYCLPFSMILASCAQEPQSEPELPGYLSFVSNATIFPPEDYYDYIIVGGGTAGCPLAATLSYRHRVLVLERGGIPNDKPNLMTQDGFLTTLNDANSYDSPAQSFTSEDGVPNARGRVLGGSSAINAGFYSRADADFFANSGLSWELKLVNESYQWVEKAIVFEPQLKTWQSAVRDALLEAGVDPYNGFSLDHYIGTKIGGSTFDSSGRRHSSADLLSYARASNIKVAVYASVERVLLASSSSFADSKQTAIGVVYRDQLGRHHHAMTRDNGEVILCAGAIGSPQLLLLSGIGSRPYLSSWGIPVAHHLPYVGQYLYDNPRNGINIVPSIPLESSLIQVVGITDSGAYIEASSNLVPFTSSFPHSLFIGAPLSPIYIMVASIVTKIAGPVSSGFLRLSSTDVKLNPILRFNYFSNPIDIGRCVNGTRKISEVLRSRAMRDFKFRNWLGAEDFRFVGPALPIDESNFGDMEEFCRRTVSTIWHYHGGCVVGSVVDGDLRVIGIESLRVVDGSVFGVSPGTNPQATLMMLGRYMGLKMIRERARRR